MAVQLCPHVTSHAADTTAKLPAIHVLSFLPWHTVSTHWFVVILLLVCLFPFFLLCKDGVFLPSPVLILLILFLVCFWFFCLDFSWAVAFPAEKWQAHIFFSLLVLNCSREGSGKLPSSLFGICCPCSPWLRHRHLGFHSMSVIFTPKCKGGSSVYPQLTPPF